MAGAQPAVECAICGRTLLVGEQSERYSPDGIEYVEVCPLCRDQAVEAGWYREGGGSLPLRPQPQRRGLFARLFKAPPPPPPPVAQPILSRLSPEEQLVMQAAALFNSSSHRRTIEGLIRSLGVPRASIAPAESGEAHVLVYWDISWYRYSVLPGEPEPVQLVDRGFDVQEIDTNPSPSWAAAVDVQGRLAPDVTAE